MNLKRLQIDLLHRFRGRKTALVLAIGFLLGSMLVFGSMVHQKESMFFGAGQKTVNRSHNSVLSASMVQVPYFGNRAKPVPDSERLSNKIMPVIKKSIGRYPPYYLFIFLGGFVLFALIRLIEPSYLNSVFRAGININLLLNLFKEGVFGFNLTGLLLDLVCVCMTGMFIQAYFFSGAPQMFVWITGFVAMAYILKLILIQLLANVFVGRLGALVHILMQLLFTRLLGLILLPLLFFALYQPVFDVRELLGHALICIFFLYMAWFMRLFIKINSMTKAGILYLFLYLCTVELSTLAILVRNYIQ